MLRARAYGLRISLLILCARIAIAASNDPKVGDQAWQVLEKHCLVCHDASNPAGLDLHYRASILKGGMRGAAALVGNAEASLLYRAAAHIGDLKMPPGTQAPLPSNDLGILKRWIDAGLPPPSKPGEPATHWAFRPIRKLAPPQDTSGWSKNGVDLFVLEKLRTKGLTPVATADKRILLRRAYFDLIGLPPTPDEISAFLADKSPDAYPNLIDRLLSSPRYGERWGRHWMDVVHYADTAGDNADYPVPEARLYRDYIIDSFNADKPYDQFVREQLAGDILARGGTADKYAERVIATGYLALTRRYAGASFPYEMWYLAMEDAIETAGRTFMALTLRCARCHDHKFDPVTTRDYYALYGIFASTKFPYAGSEMMGGPKVPGRMSFVPLVPPMQAQPKLAAYQQKVDALENEIKGIEEDPILKPVAELYEKVAAEESRARRNIHEGLYLDTQGLPPTQLPEYHDLKIKRDAAAAELAKAHPDHATAPDRLLKLRETYAHLARPGLPDDLPGAYAAQEGECTNVHVQIGGEPESPGPLVRRNLPLFLTGGEGVPIPENSSGRLELADWLTRPDNPLTARVMVNRIWQHHFGKGIVATPSNFGTRGDPPTHPELLDWLAIQFIESGWSVKAMHRLIMLSRTYQLASSPNDQDAAIDPANRYYWRFKRKRLEAEAIRDSMLSVAGDLDLSRPGAHPFPPMDDWSFTQHVPFKAVYNSNHRSVYLMTQRLVRHPYLSLFDAPDTNVSTDARANSTVPLQALYLLNNSFVLQQAETFAKRLLAASADTVDRLNLGARTAWGRTLEPREQGKYLAYIKRYRDESLRAGASHEEAELAAWSSFAHALITTNEFMYID
ncbi:MAG TPA: PSD1 and planctomycete cytochrome C domain-containing protein [Bryobacteraceae bacterium]|nr:PSD1 and planctomycete cytochrome C domain-containing protein [Bryobacteraceae bacterium]